jgi:hypothetical protein
MHGLSIPNPNFSEFVVFGKYICRLGIVDFNLPIEIDELVCSKNPKLLFYFSVLRSWGWNLTIVGGQPKNAYCRIYSLWSSLGMRQAIRTRSDDRMSRNRGIWHLPPRFI